MITRGSIRFIGLLLITVLAFGCSDDSDDSSGGSGGGTAGGGSGTGGGGSGTGGGGSGTGGGGGTGGAAGDAGEVVMCGGETCEVVPSATQDLPACCDEIENKCGAIVNMEGTECVATDLPGEEDSSCPTELSVISTDVPGCCTPDGKCGLLSGTLRGCVERSRYPVAFLNTAEALDSVDCGGGSGDGGT